MIATDIFHACMEDLENRIDEAQEQAVLDAWLNFTHDGCSDEVFVPPNRTPAPPAVEWPQMSVNDAQRDVDTMVLHQLSMVSGAIAGEGGNQLNVRCNYGTGIMATPFGCEAFWLDDELNTLPTARPLGREKIPALIDAGVPDVNAGLGEKIFAAARRFQEVFEQYPKIGRWVWLYHPDTQGPIDIVELVWGSGMFLAFYDEPQLLHEFLDLATETYAAFTRAWYDLVPETTDYTVHWGKVLSGRLMIRNDSAMNLSPETYLEFVRPYDQRLFDEFGGGGIHFCGRGDHYIEAMSEMKGLTAVNMSQPHLNDMEIIYRNTVDKGIKLVGFSGEWAEKAGRPLRGQVECSSFTTAPLGAYPLDKQP